MATGRRDRKRESRAQVAGGDIRCPGERSGGKLVSPAALITANFFREQRILLSLMLAYVVVGGGTLALLAQAPDADDVVFLIKQHAAYAVLLGVTLASTAIHNERKTRRILAVLSKGISRWQYVAGM